MRALAIVFAPSDYLQCARIAESCLHLGTTASLDAQDDGAAAAAGKNGTNAARDATRGDTKDIARDAHSAVLLDITGCARLFGKTPEDGEAAIIKEAEARVSALGIPCRVAIADGARVARAVAWFGREARAIVAPGQAKAALSKLPLAVLPLPEKARAWLARLGIATVAALLALPRKELGNRLGASEKDVFALAEGEDRAPLVPYVPPSVPEESVDLDVGIDSHEALAFVLKMLAARMSARLVGRGKAIAKLELVLSLDVAALTASKRESVARNAGNSDDHNSGDHAARRRALHTETLVLPAPLSTEKDLLVVLRAKIERQQLAAPVRGVTLRATELVEKPARVLSLFSALPRAEGVLARLAGELFAEGYDVGELGLRDTWEPAKRSILVPLGTTQSNDAKAMRARLKQKQSPLSESGVSLSGAASVLGAAPGLGAVPGSGAASEPAFELAPEPTLIVESPVTVERKDVKQVRFLSRVECIHWWRDERIAVDRVMSRVGDALACVEMDRMTGAAHVTGYFD